MSQPAVAPLDPRDPPPFGSLPTRSRLDELTDRVLADNPSPMTLDGTNTLVVGDRAAGEVMVVDPGPDDPDHRAEVDRTVAGRDAAVVAILLTHHHIDHVEAASAWARDWDVPVRASRPELCRGADPLQHGDTLRLAGTTVDVVGTPGHTADHLAFRIGTGALLTGDHVLGRGTSVVAHPDGDLAAYLSSLRRVLGLGPDALHPGHGPSLTDDPMAVVRYYLDHREHRLAQLRHLLVEGPATPRELVETIYVDHDRSVWGAAEASTRAGLEALVAAGEVQDLGDGRFARG